MDRIVRELFSIEQLLNRAEMKLATKDNTGWKDLVVIADKLASFDAKPQITQKFRGFVKIVDAPPEPEVASEQASKVVEKKEKEESVKVSTATKKASKKDKGKEEKGKETTSKDGKDKESKDGEANGKLDKSKEGKSEPLVAPPVEEQTPLEGSKDALGQKIQEKPSEPAGKSVQAGKSHKKKAAKKAEEPGEADEATPHEVAPERAPEAAVAPADAEQKEKIDLPVLIAEQHNKGNEPLAEANITASEPVPLSEQQKNALTDEPLTSKQESNQQLQANKQEIAGIKEKTIALLAQEANLTRSEISALESSAASQAQESTQEPVEKLAVSAKRNESLQESDSFTNLSNQYDEADELALLLIEKKRLPVKPRNKQYLLPEEQLVNRTAEYSAVVLYQKLKLEFPLM